MVVLWIAHGDLGRLPASVRELEDEGLTIAATSDLRSYKKIIPALLAWPDAAIVTADDDLHYRPDWLADLVDAWHADPGTLPCHRAHQIRFASDRSALRYRDWEFNIAERPANAMVFPTSGAGVLYPPGTLHPDVTREELFMAMSPMADDVWLYCMARLGHRQFRKVGPRRRLVTWETSQGTALSHFNLIDGGNDLQLRNVLDHYGPDLSILGAREAA